MKVDVEGGMRNGGATSELPGILRILCEYVDHVPVVGTVESERVTYFKREYKLD